MKKFYFLFHSTGIFYLTSSPPDHCTLYESIEFIDSDKKDMDFTSTRKLDNGFVLPEFVGGLS